MQFEMSVDYIEQMLTQQLIVAIGKQVHANDFEEFTKFHFKNKFFAEQFQPTPFCFAMRGHPGQYPDGILSIESATATSSKMEPIETFARHLECDKDTPPIHVPLNASTTVLITGDRYLHGWLCHSFFGQNPPQYQLAARARQFSCFLVMVGKMAGPDEFAPQEAIILQNKDEVLIPLLLNQLPTAKEFNDAISSMSPEQQSFAKAFRAMQLESSVFGVCVVKVKPQLESVLALPKGSLIKDIKLTQDLLSLFIDYQIPTDLLSFDGPEHTDKVDRLNAVRSHTKAVMDIIESNKKYNMKSEAQMSQVQQAQQIGAAYPPSNDALGVRTTVPMSLGDMMRLPAVACKKTYEERMNVSMKKEKVDQARIMMQMEAKNIKMRQMQQLRDNTFARMEGFGGGGQQDPKSFFGDEVWATAPQAPRVIAKSGMRLGRPKKSINDASMAHSPSQGAANYKSQASGDASDHNQGLLDSSAFMGANGDDIIEDHFDFTSIPKVLDTKFEAFDTTRGNNSSVRPTTIDTKGGWLRRHQENLLTAMKTSYLGIDKIRSEKNKAFDLLDALTRSGSLPLEHSELHVIVAVTHCFENDVMGTVIQDNVNPIEKVEKSSLIMASTIHNITPRGLLRFREDAARLQLTFPAMFDE